MSTRLYKINGEYNTFEYWHDHYGYTKTPTFSIQYKTTNPWGAAFASGGYYDAEDLMDIFTFSFFVPGVVGWNEIDDLALVGYYPAAATDLTVARDSEVSNAATLTQDDETYYLVQNDIEYGWMSQAEFEARGWSTDVGYPPSYIVFDTTTGTIVHSVVDEGMVYGDVGYVLMDEAGSMITVYETGVRTESFYFTTNGRNEMQNTNISHADIPVYLEDGTAPAADTPYDGSTVLAFMDVDGNTKQADGESLYVDEGVLRLDAPDTDEGEQWAALVEHKDIVLKVKWGDTVNVPSGYKAVEVRTFVGYAFKSYFGDFSGDSSKIVAFPGKNVYFDNIPGHEMLSARTYSDDPISKWPLVEVFQTTGQHLVGKYLTVGYKNSVPEWSTQDRLTNGIDSTAGEYSVYLRGSNTTAIINAINSSYPVRYLWFIFDDQGNACWWKSPEAFRVPSSLWSFVNGVFSWLGNSEDTTSLAWYYKHDWELFEWEEFDGVWFYVHCKREF